MTLGEMKKAIIEMPATGEWWNADGERTFIALGRELVNAGWDPEDAVAFLDRAYGAVANEYGC